MNSSIKISLMALLLVPLFACGAKEEPTGVIPQGHLDAMDKAKNVENVLQDAKQRADEGVDASD